MTREEAIHIIDVAFGIPRAVRRFGEDRTYQEDEIREAKNMAIEALEQEPCEDAISRQAVLKCFTWTNDKADIWYKIKALPSVTPQPKIGHWINDKCSACGKGIENLIDSREWYRNEEPKFCPFCGLKLVEPQESEDKE